MIFNRQLYKQKPSAWGPVSNVQASIFKNAERIGIVPASIALAMPMWGPGNKLDYSGNHSSATLYNVEFSRNSLLLNNSSYLTVSHNAAVDYFSSGTVIVHVDVISATSSTAPYYINKNIGGGNISWGIGRVYSSPGTLRWIVNAGTDYEYTLSNSTLGDTRFALSWGGGVGKSFYNGILKNSGTYTGSVVTSISDLVIGRLIGYGYSPGYYQGAYVFTKSLSDSQIAYLSDNPYYLLQRVAPVYYSVPGGAITITTSLDGKVIIRTTTSALLDCMASIKNNAINFLDCAAAVSTTKKDSIDGKAVLKRVASSVFDSKTSVLSVASLLLDGKAIVSDTGSALLDGKGAVKDSTYNIVDGKSIIKSMNTAILDGKSIFLSAGNSVIDGKIIVNAEGFSSALLDGKTIIKSVVTNYLDGLIYIGNAADKNIDGKAIIKSEVCLTIDCKTTIQDVASNLLDGSASILTSIAHIVDGKIIISDAAIGLLDGKSVILDDSSIILDGKVFISSGSEINIFDGKITLSVPIVGKVTVSFSMRSPSVSFAIRTPAATFSIN